jgi:two-component system, LytTR family, response regulator
LTLRAMIVDDEPLARQRLRAMLEATREVKVVGEAESAEAATLLLPEVVPDVIFLDINMPGKNGLELLETIDAPPAVVFTTAYPEFAADAFELNAADYLVKPFDAERLAKSIQRTLRFVDGGRAPRSSRTGPHRERFAIRTRGEIIFIKSSQIDWISAEGNYSRLHGGEKSWLVREPLQSIEDSLDPAIFIRVHRSTIVNLDRIRKVITPSDTSASIVLSTGDAVPLGPSYRGRLEEAVGEKL